MKANTAQFIVETAMMLVGISAVALSINEFSVTNSLLLIIALFLYNISDNVRKLQ